MSERAAYDDVIMDHIRNARNYRAMEGASLVQSAVNPMCGDEMLVYVALDRDRVADVAFQCSCCGISMASASMMTEAVKGRSVADTRAMIDEFVRTIESGARDAPNLRTEWRAIVETLARFPSRAACALLGWTTLKAALAAANAR